MNIILASKSPRRHELLNQINIKHQIIVEETEEKIEPNQTPQEVVTKISYQKGINVSKKHPNDIVISADTVVVIENEILGKPKNKEIAIQMLTKLSGKTHHVLTGVNIFYQNKVHTFVESTAVTFYEMSQQEIEEYIDNENVYDKAGSYAIQGMCAKHIKEINGDYNNIVGLPIAKLYQTLKENKYI